MQDRSLKDFIDDLDVGGEPRVEILKREVTGSNDVGVFASSFNPPTIAHVELANRAADAFSLNEVLALAGKANADKTTYECSLVDRLAMLLLAFADDARISVALSSHAFYADILDALERVYPQSDLHFIVGFDTFERVLDLQGKYTPRYYRKFEGRLEAIEYVLTRSSFLVAGRAGAGRAELRTLVATLPERLREQVAYLDLPTDLGERSATEVRTRARAGKSISSLVPPNVAQYIEERGLYGALRR